MKFLSKITLRFQADFLGFVLTSTIPTENIERYLLLCRSLPKKRKSGLSGFSSSSFTYIHDWTRAMHDGKLLCAVAELLDAQDPYSWLSSA